MKAPSYFGGKSGNGTYQTIICQIPEIHTYIEPMIGRGGVFRNLNLPQRVIINDIDSNVIHQYNYDTWRKIKPTIIIENTDYVSCIDEFVYDCSNVYCGIDKTFYHAGTLVYFDPPYHFETRKSKRMVYNYEWSHQQHIDFLNYAAALPCKVVISHYPCLLYDTLLSSWRKIEFQSMTRAGLATEALYMNYPEPVKLQDYRYIGKDFTDRQRIKRITLNIIKKLSSMTDLNRNAILFEINKKFYL